MRHRTKKRINWVMLLVSMYILFFAMKVYAVETGAVMDEISPFQEFLVSLAAQYPIVGGVLTVLAVLVILFSLVVAAFPRVDSNGKWAKIVKFFDFLSVFYPKWKSAESDGADAGQTD